MIFITLHYGLSLLSEITPTNVKVFEGPTFMIILFQYIWLCESVVTQLDCHCLRQEIFLTQGLNLGLPHCGQILYCLSYINIAKHSYIAIYSYIAKHSYINIFPRGICLYRQYLFYYLIFLGN